MLLLYDAFADLLRRYADDVDAADAMLLLMMLCLRRHFCHADTLFRRRCHDAMMPLFSFILILLPAAFRCRLMLLLRAAFTRDIRYGADAMLMLAMLIP